jgi:hypothetical protein
VLKEREHLSVEQPIEEVIHHLADDLARADDRPIHIAPTLAVGLEIALGFEASQVCLYGFEIEPALFGQGIQDLAYGRPAPIPDDASDFELRLCRHRTLGHLRSPDGVRLKAIIAFK